MRGGYIPTPLVRNNKNQMMKYERRLYPHPFLSSVYLLSAHVHPIRYGGIKKPKENIGRFDTSNSVTPHVSRYKSEKNISKFYLNIYIDISMNGLICKGYPPLP